jgi:CHASE2 domain-containing sensor protein
MRKVICLRFGQGNLQEGVTEVVASLYEITNEPAKFLEEINCSSLPANPEIAIAYQKWQLLYNGFVNCGKKGIDFNTRAITFDENSIDRGNQENAAKIPAYLITQLNEWLDSREFQEIDRTLRERINLEDEVVLVIQTNDEIFRKLPWQEWNFIKKYTKAEVALSAPQFSSKQKSATAAGKVRILAIVGDSTNIDSEADLKSLENNQDVEMETVPPSRQHICDRLRDKSGWDILFYTGHSTSNAEKGWIQLNKDTKLEISELNLALQVAVENGLQLAIFNSCQGMGLVPQLETSGISQVIVMRESIQNKVAQTFLAEFVASFSGGKSFYVAIREARNRLKEIENEYYCASWLPVVCQHWSTKVPTWEELRGTIPPPPSIKYPFLKSGGIGLLIAGSIILIRSLGLLQNLELKAFDLLMKMRPHEGIDSRLLVVEATEEDINSLGYPLPDRILAQTIERIEQYQPRVIGLQIFRDRPVEPGHQQLLNLLQNNDRLVALCSAKLSHDDPNESGIPSPPGIPENRLGFSNLIRPEDPDRVLRRYTLFMHPEVNNSCLTSFSFGFQLASQYLKQEGIEAQRNQRDERNKFDINQVTFERLQTNSGGYRNLEERGFQLLINYRNAEKIAPTIRINDVLDDRFDPNLVKNRIVIIGVVAPTSNPTRFFVTPFGNEMSGVTIQAQMTSQILSAVLDKRPLLKTWSETVEIISIVICSLAGSIIAIFHIKNRTYYWLALCSGIFIWGIISYLSLSFLGLWLPLVPSTAGLIISGIGGKIAIKNWRKITERTSWGILGLSQLLINFNLSKDKDIT